MSMSLNLRKHSASDASDELVRFDDPACIESESRGIPLQHTISCKNLARSRSGNVVPVSQPEGLGLCFSSLPGLCKFSSKRRCLSIVIGN